MEIKRISTEHPLYKQEQNLRNEVLLRPIGVPDHAWEMYDKASYHFLAVDNNEVWGCVVLRPLVNEKHKNSTAQLMQMAVKSNLQSKGIGRKLVDDLLVFAKEEGFEKVICHARNNVVVFYEKLGFQVYGEPFEEVGIQHRHMRMCL